MPTRRNIICTYCGPNRTRPRGYDRVGSPYECLRSGIGVGTHQERRKWQYATGRRVDPEYISPCPHLPPRVRSARNRNRRVVRRTPARQRARRSRAQSRSRSRSRIRSRTRARRIRTGQRARRSPTRNRRAVRRSRSRSFSI